MGRITRQQGIQHLVDAFPHLDSGAQLVLGAGAPDTPEIAREIAAAVRRAQAARKGVVWIQEMVERLTAIELYSHAAVFCCPSIYEPFGLINLEATACGAPVVASAVGRIPEVVVHGETGYLVRLGPRAAGSPEPADPERFGRDLVAATNALLADPALRRAMGRQGRQRAEAHFSWRAIAQATLALYESLLGSKADASAPPGA